MFTFFKFVVFIHFSHFLVYVVFISSIHVIVHESSFHGKWLNLRLHDCVWSWKCVRAFRATATMSKCHVWLYCCCASVSSKQYKLLTRRTKPFFCHIIECVHILLIVGYNMYLQQQDGGLYIGVCSWLCLTKVYLLPAEIWEAHPFQNWCWIFMTFA